MNSRKIFIIAVVLFIFYIIISQFYAFRLDEEANEAFLKKANDLQIIGKDQEFIKKHFGFPAYARLSDDGSVWVYVPGAEYTSLGHECKIAFDTDGKVVGWAVRLD